MALPSAGPTDCSSGLSNRIFNNLRYDNPWQANQSGVVVGTLCCPTVPNGIGFKCTAITTGITGSVEPTWPTILTTAVVDGGVTWTAQDVANPSGKAHPPAGQFGYPFTSSDLDGFRLLAYNTARGVADEILSGDRVMYHATVNQAFPAAVAFATINYDTSDADTNGLVTNPGSNWVFTCKKNGLYLLTATVEGTPGGSGGDTILLAKKNGQEYAFGQRYTLANIGTLCMVLSQVVPLLATDTIVFAFYTPSSTFTLEASTQPNRNRAAVTQLVGY